MDSSPSQCHALNLSDEQRCLETATSVNGLFCSFHSRQCQALYRGYKLRTARLDRLNEKPPPYLANAKTSISKETFENVTTHEECKEVHNWLWARFQLLERVIKARRLHHSRFFSLQMDYGHEKFLDQLLNQKVVVEKALERIERRTAEVLYKDQQWFQWVRGCQDDEEANREKEQKKIKQEAQLWQRHWKQAKQRLEEKRRREEKKKADAFLEKVYKEKMKDLESEDADDDMDWDPIDDILEDGRGGFIDLIRHFLWMAIPESPTTSAATSNEGNPTGETLPITSIPKDSTTVPEASTKNKKTRKKKKTATSSTQVQQPDKSLIESREDMQARLMHGSVIDRARWSGLVEGAMENPHSIVKTRSFPEDEAKRLLSEIGEIKHLLFCRLLLSHRALLPAALRADSIEEFLADEEVTGAALRDICLKMEKPELQEIRDACADYFRSEQEEEDADQEHQAQTDDSEDEDKPKDPYDIRFGTRRIPGDLPEKWISKRERARQNAQEKFGDFSDMFSAQTVLGGEAGTAIDFGDMKSLESKPKKIRVKLCGRSIWNYPSNKTMSRGGWLHFCLIAKDSGLNDAVELCRNWEEFFELNILACWHYFPAANWIAWVRNRYTQQVLQLGFIMYSDSSHQDAYDLTVKHTQGRHGQSRRAHAVFEARNFICAHIKRDDQASRRLVQYLSMHSHRLFVLVRDAESGRILVKPPEEERWLWREKSGLGRASKNEWNVLKKVGPQFFEEMERVRGWSFSFKEYYDVYIWDNGAGEPFASLFNVVQGMLLKAVRCRSGKDFYKLAAPVLKTIYRDENGKYCNKVHKGAEVRSVWDVMSDDSSKFYYGEVRPGGQFEGTAEANKFPRHLLYNEVDVLEDKVLFPEEENAEDAQDSGVGKLDSLKIWEEGGVSLKAFIEASWEWEDSDYESDEILGSDEDSDDLSDNHIFEKCKEKDQTIDYIKDEEEDEDEDDDDYEDISESEEAYLPPAPDGGAVTDYSEHGLSLFPEALRDVMRRLSIKAKRMPDKGDQSAMGDEFYSFLDKEKAGVFKKVWHKADLTPNAQARYAEMMTMARKSRRFNQRDLKNPSTLLSFELLDWLDVLPPDSKDLHKALGKVYPFFEPQFLDSKGGKEFQKSLMFDQEERAKHFPDMRTHISTANRPRQFYDEFDKEFKKFEKAGQDFDVLPLEWDLITRPIIAQLYKSGVIRTRTSVGFSGQAFCATEPARPMKPDLFIDYRSLMENVAVLENPSKVPAHLLTAQQFSKVNPNAKFSVIHMWSAAHFYPLMIGYENRDAMSFRDLTGRIYEWLFVPKDMPQSEYSIHHAAKLRIEPFRRLFGKKVVPKRDKFLVMGENEADLLKLTAAVTYAVQAKPWRMEVDLWKSFMNVDLDFLERLDERWWWD